GTHPLLLSFPTRRSSDLVEGVDVPGSDFHGQRGAVDARALSRFRGNAVRLASRAGLDTCTGMRAIMRVRPGPCAPGHRDPQAYICAPVPTWPPRSAIPRWSACAVPRS